MTTLMHLVKGFIGTGIFAMGEGLKFSGHVFGLILITLVAAINLNCQHILIETAAKIAEEEEEDVKPSYAETVEYTMELSSINWFKDHSRKFGFTTTAFIMTAELDGLAPDGERYYISDCKNLYRFFCIAIFSYEGIPLVKWTLIDLLTITMILPLKNEMKNPEKFAAPFGVMNVAMVIVTLLYGLVGFLAYWKFGDEVESSVFLNLPEGEILPELTKGLICVGIMLTFTLHMYIPFEVTYPLFYRKYGPFKYKMLMKYVYRSIPVLITCNTLANVVPFLGLFISLLGATTGAMLGIIIPPILQMIAFKGELKLFVIIKDIIIIIIGIIALVVGTVLSIKDIIEEFRKQKY
ncbi:Aa trans domain containing protein, partial [Asbolus verrucosus]